MRDKDGGNALRWLSSMGQTPEAWGMTKDPMGAAATLYPYQQLQNVINSTPWYKKTPDVAGTPMVHNQVGPGGDIQSMFGYGAHMLSPEQMAEAEDYNQLIAMFVGQ